MRPASLADFSGPVRGSGEELNYMSCPVCGSQGWNLYVNEYTGRWFCFAARHGRGGRVQTEDWTDQAKQELLALISYGVPHLPEWPEVSLPEWRPLGVIARNYLQRRGVLQTTCGHLGIREMAVSPRILVPYRGPHGRIIHWTGRAFGSEIVDARVPKYMSAPGAKPLFVLPLWEAVPAAVLVEGPFDAIAVWQATGIPTVALGGKTLSRACERDLRRLVRRKVWIMLDGDAQGSAITLMEQLMDQYECKLIPLEGKQDPGSLSKDDIRCLLESGT